jgi:hypothetical protein
MPGRPEKRAHLPGHRRHAGERGHPLALDEPQRLLGVPLVHEHQTTTGAEGGQEDRVAAGDVEQGHGHEHARRRRRILRRAAQRRHGDVGLEAQHRGQDRPVRGDGALREACGPRGVHDRRVVVGVDVHRGHGRPAAGGDHLGEVEGARRERALRARDEQREVERLDLRGDAVVALLIDHEQPRAGIREPVDHLLGGPPGVHGHGDRAHGGHRHEGDDPFRMVAHGDRHAIARAHAEVGRQPVRQGRGVGVHLGEGAALVAVDQEVGGAVLLTAGGVEFGETTRRVREDAQPDAAHVGLCALVRGAGGGEAGASLLVIQGANLAISDNCFSLQFCRA